MAIAQNERLLQRRCKIREFIWVRRTLSCRERHPPAAGNAGRPAVALDNRPGFFLRTRAYPNGRLSWRPASITRWMARPPDLLLHLLLLRTGISRARPYQTKRE